MDTQTVIQIVETVVIIIAQYAAFAGTPVWVGRAKLLATIWRVIAGNHSKAENLRD